MCTVPLAWSWTLTYQYPSTPNPTSSHSRNAVVPCHSQTPWCHPWSHPLPIRNGISTSFKILPIPWYQHPITSLDLPYPYFLFPPLAAPANTGQSSSTADEGRSAGWKLRYLFIFLLHLESPAMSTGSSQVGAALSPYF